MASQQIVAAVRQEVTGVDQVNSAMGDINNAIQQFVSAIRQTEEANNDLAVMADKLHRSISVYKIKEPHGTRSKNTQAVVTDFQQ
jgi:methyl-accepting chemotaxis protein